MGGRTQRLRLEDKEVAGMSIAFRCLPKEIRKRRRGLVKWLRKWFNAEIERDLLLPALLQCDCTFLSLFLSTLELIVPPTLRWLKVRHQINSIIIIIIYTFCKTQWQKQITQMVNKPLQRNLNHNRKYRPTAAKRNKNSKRAKRPTLTGWHRRSAQIKSILCPS